MFPYIIYYFYFLQNQGTAHLEKLHFFCPDHFLSYPAVSAREDGSSIVVLGR